MCLRVLYIKGLLVLARYATVLQVLPRATSTANMKLIIVACLVAMALAAPRPEDDVSILRDDAVDQGDGNFNYNFELSDGTAIGAEGTPNDAGSVNIEGSYRFTLPDGAVVEITYVADEAGFRPQGTSSPPPTTPRTPLSRLDSPRSRERQE
ncbi:cuticle protein AMP1A-like [Macrobrachium nipponense]|uniref:cuticle protein AMP1A-like n=1 Tax=Macrobrachium nipponense TaxID=159736 RepID=UPI0030C89101